MGCPDPNTLQALRDGDLGGSEREAVLEHADGCGECRELLAALVRTLPAPSHPDAAPVAERASPSLLVQGARVGRYEIDSFIGAGGIGLVYAAHDPELARRVAVKLLRSGHAGDAQQLLVREARAMARVSHPNVLTVLDVGTWQDRVYVVMELASGGDLRGWLAARRRSLAEIVDVFRAAGRGLAAAHAAGLVHRDFKPDNVLVSDDGRVRVTDFGFAHAVDAGAAGEGGTPAYMAPEQREGGNLDARTDQYAFCAALYEAVYGERPGPDGASRPPPGGAAVPASLRRIVLRGLARVPGDRWPTMDLLLAALGRDRARVPRRIAAAAAAVLAVVATAGAGDWVVRARLHAAARAAFDVTRAQVGHALALRNEAFSTFAELSLQLPILREVAAVRDLSNAGLGTPERDAADLATLHASLRDADWNAWSSTVARGDIAIADYQGRLLYSTADPDRFGDGVRGLGAVAAAYRTRGSAMEITRADGPGARAAGLGVRRGLLLVLARAAVSGGVPQAVFVQAIGARRFLADLDPGPELALALVALDGSAEGDVPPALIDRARDATGAGEVAIGGAEWFVESVPVGGPEAPIGRVMMARRADVGLAGLFPHARAVLAALGLAAMGLLGGALWRVRAVARERGTISVRPSPARFSSR